MLITVDEAKTFLGVTGSGDDDMIESFILSAQAEIERVACRHIEAATRTEIIDGTGLRDLWLAEPPESILTIHVSSDQEWDADSLLDSDSYRIARAGSCRVQRLDGTWVNGQANTKIVYQAGFADPGENLLYAVKVQVSKLYAEWTHHKQGLTIRPEVSTEGERVKFAPRRSLDPEAREIAEDYIPDRV